MRGCSWHCDVEATPATEEERLHREASHRAHRRMEFLHHLAVFVPVMLLILAIDALAGDDWFVQWVAGIWGGILAIHFLHTFVIDDLRTRDGAPACGIAAEALRRPRPKEID